MATAGHEILEKYENSLYQKNHYNLISHIEKKNQYMHWTIFFSNRGIQESTN